MSTLIINSIQQLANSKDLKKYTNIKEELTELNSVFSTSSTQDELKKEKNTNILQAAKVLSLIEKLVKTKNATLQTSALDLLSKIISYNYFSERDMEAVVELINQSFAGENTDDKVLIQIFKALQAAVTSASIHDSTLLTVVRTAYNIFVFSKKGPYQSVAQSILSQMILFIFGRIEIPEKYRGDIEHYSGPPQSTQTQKEKSSTEICKEIVDELVDDACLKFKSDEFETHLRDAYLVFRALCRLSLKPLPELTPSKRDLHLIALRSKILSLELLSVIVREHFPVVSCTFPIHGIIQNNATEEQPQQGDGKMEGDSIDKNSAAITTFVQGVKQYLCVSLSRNAVSLVPEVLDRSLEIFIRLVFGMRHSLKKEIEVFFSDILLATLESKSNLAITYHQKLSLLKAISTLTSSPQTLIELYLNYDCDPEALDNIYERIVSIMSKMLTSRELKLLQTAPALPAGEIGLDVGGFGISSSSTIITPPSVQLSKSSSSLLKPQSPIAESPKSQVSPVNHNFNSVSNTLCPEIMAPASISLGLLPLTADKDQSLKWRSLECLATMLQSMVVWNQQKTSQDLSTASPIVANHDETDDENSPVAVMYKQKGGNNSTNTSVVAVADDRFESAKNLKVTIKEGVQLFNWRYKKGMQYLLSHGVIQSTPESISKFLLQTQGLNKKEIGEYLGEGEPFNIQVMHAFVDQLDFTSLKFVPALRKFLQAFRLPGEAQKIDRFMLKFAERYVLQNPGVFTNADTAYVLAYSVVMLNTDLYNPQVKKRMTRQEFIRNNRGINDGKDLPQEFLETVFDDIASEEIRMKDEIPVSAAQQSGDKKQESEFVQMSDRQKKEALFQVSEEIAKRSEAAFKQGSNRGDRQGVSAHPFYLARQAEHLRSMFDSSWMPMLAGVSNALQEADIGDVDTIKLALYTFRSAVHLSCVFDHSETARNAFISTLAKTAYLTNIADLLQRPKNVESIKSLLEIAYLDGNWLKGSWVDVFRCVSALERLLSAAGDFGNVEMGGVIPGVATGISRESGDDDRRSIVSGSNLDRQQQKGKHQSKGPGGILTIQEETIVQNMSQNLLVQLDKLFTSSNRLSGTAIVEFVRWLCVVSLEEIQQSTSSSPLNTIPRMYSLTKLVEISYYNMNRIRLEWSQIWAILGQHLNQVGTHANQHVALFAADSLRQMSMKFLEKQELSNFKFQKDFLKPFEHILSNHQSLVIKDMVMRCIHQLIHAKSQNIRSGWKAIFAVLIRAARDKDEQIVLMSFELVRHLNDRYFQEVMIDQQTFPDFVSCLVEFSKNKSFPKVNLQSVELLRNCVSKVVKSTSGVSKQQSSESTENIQDLLLTSPLNLNSAAKNALSSKDDPILRLWFPIHFGLYEMIMQGDIEVRSKALHYLFDILKEHGQSFSTEFWDVLSRGVIFPIFDDLKLSKAEQRQFENKEEMTIWLNTTLIQALRQLVDLFSYSFTSLESMMLDGVLELILVCFSVKQDNETLAKIGSSCLEQLITNNAHKMHDGHWDKVIKSVETLFQNTRPDLLDNQEFMSEIISRVDRNTKSTENVSKIDVEDQVVEIEDQSSSSGAQSTPTLPRTPKKDGTSMTSKQLKKDFQLITLKCVLHLSVIKTISDILESEKFKVYQNIKSQYLIRLLKCCNESYSFARTFNGNMPFRIALYKNGFMSQIPNLLKQETLSAQCVLFNLFKIYRHAFQSSINDQYQDLMFDLHQDRLSVVNQVQPWMMQISSDILINFNVLDPAVKKRNINTWTPVVCCILDGINSMPDENFKQHTSTVYKSVLGIIAKHELTPTLKNSVYEILARVDQIWRISK